MLKNTTQPTTTDKSEKTNQSSETSKTEEKSSNLSTKNTSSKTESKDTSTKSESLWIDEPSEAYRKFLIYTKKISKALDTSQFKLFKSKVFDTTNKIDVACINEGKLSQLNNLLNLPLYCDRLTIRNFPEANLQFYFNKESLKDIVGIISDYGYAKHIKIARRSIVTTNFITINLPGPVQFNEYLIDGNNYKERNENDDLIKFILNPETSIRIIFENCKNSVKIDGLSANEIETIFDNRCKDNLELINESESSKKLSPT